jgi:hypothetical protein
VIYDLNSRGEFSAACALLAVTLLAKGLVALGGYGVFKAVAWTLRYRSARTS